MLLETAELLDSEFLEVRFRNGVKKYSPVPSVGTCPMDTGITRPRPPAQMRCFARRLPSRLGIGAKETTQIDTDRMPLSVASKSYALSHVADEKRDRSASDRGSRSELTLL